MKPPHLNIGLPNDPEVREGFLHLWEVMKKSWKQTTFVAVLLVVAVMVNLCRPLFQLWVDDSNEQLLWVISYATAIGIIPAVEIVQFQYQTTVMREAETNLHERVFRHLTNVLTEDFDKHHRPGEILNSRQVLFDLAKKAAETLSYVLGNVLLGVLYLVFALVAGGEYLQWWWIFCLSILFGGSKGLTKISDYLRLDTYREYSRRCFARLDFRDSLRMSKTLDLGFKQNSSEIELATRLYQLSALFIKPLEKRKGGE